MRFRTQNLEPETENRELLKERGRDGERGGCSGSGSWQLATENPERSSD
jgi:hypothetical protein